MTSEQEARKEIDRLLEAADWRIQDVKRIDLHAGRGVVLREFPLEYGFGLAEYLLYVDTKAADVIEAKKVGATLTGVETQSSRYAQGLPDALPAWRRPLPFVYDSTGLETHFTIGLDPQPRARNQQAVAEGVNVNYDDVYHIRTAVSEGGGNVESGYYADLRDKLTREARWEQVDEEFAYDHAERYGEIGPHQTRFESRVLESL